MIGGKIVRIHFFVGVLGYSRRIYVKAFTAENTEAWLNGIENSFRHFGGVPLAIVSDKSGRLVLYSRTMLTLDGSSPDLDASWHMERYSFPLLKIV